MFDKLNKVQVQNIACIMIIIGCFLMGFVSMFFEISKSSEILLNKITDITLVGVVGFLFTRNSGNKASQ